MGSHGSIVDIREEVGILEIEQYAQVHQHAYRKPGLSFSFVAGDINAFAHQIIPARGKQQQQKKNAGCFVVKKDAGNKKESMTERSLFVKKRIHAKHNGKKHPKAYLSEDKRILRVEYKKPDDMLNEVLTEYHSLCATTL
jgi:hypothetical protein